MSSRALLLLLLAAACSTSQIRADAAPTDDFPTPWGFADSPARPEPSSKTQRAAVQAPPPAADKPAPRMVASSTAGLIAVLDFSNKLRGSDKESLDGAYFANQVRAEVKRTYPRMGVMTRENIIVLLQSSGKKLSECEGECEVDTGRRLGADYVISGDMLRIGSHFKVDLRLHDTRDGQLISGATDSGASPDELDANLGGAIDQLLKPLRSP